MLGFPIEYQSGSAVTLPPMFAFAMSCHSVRKPDSALGERTDCPLTNATRFARRLEFAGRNGPAQISNSGRHSCSLRCAGCDFPARICGSLPRNRHSSLSLLMLRCGRSGPAQIRTAVTATRRPKDTKLPHRPARRTRRVRSLILPDSGDRGAPTPRHSTADSTKSTASLGVSTGSTPGAS